MNDDSGYPTELDNMNGFFYSLPSLDIQWNGLAPQSFEKEGMSSLATSIN